ncbi:trehalose-phosphatase [Thiohalobacter thiocyanaticus]|uniref:Trehalose 6-phosphate phosphatase n=1 Tax=Thiohalobacter thiocyanaticus TaxID=585455 RepID=A0A426QGY7_9GAMM|nr:trehalose-phosphatase [Thiohalobacter thiocyanaticus]RRQ21014.1 trehalose-phosphatase [Thiohalobacter thiocyanaticus]
MNHTAPDKSLSAGDFDAAVFDLDGVITRTARLHAAAWKALFDEYLKQHTPADDTFQPFDIESDYRRYVDGKPRYEGVRSFLEARGIELPYGSPHDAPDAETVCGLGNRKNRLFLQRLEAGGVEVFDTSIELIRALRDAGLRTAVISSSRNCQAVLESAGIADLFDVRIDGTDLQHSDLAGKPAPDMFLQACRRLDCDPARAIGFEDAVAGVQAAHAAGYGRVIGVNRDDQHQALREGGADLVIADLGELRLATGAEATRPARRLPSALDCLDEILPGNDREPALFLDYDGTLTPIVSRPEDADLGETLRLTLQRLTGLCKLAVISGRDLDDVRERVGLDTLWYAGSHGFDIAGPAGQHFQYQKGTDYLPILDAAERALTAGLADIPGCQIERKRFSIATHYRRVSEDAVPRIGQAVEAIRNAHPGLRLTQGKKIFELQPDIDWDKGRALRWMMRTLGLDRHGYLPLYIGDDVTDEDAFRALKDDGIGILVTQDNPSTHADYRLDDPAAVETLLNHIAERLERSAS